MQHLQYKSPRYNIKIAGLFAPATSTFIHRTTTHFISLFYGIFSGGCHPTRFSFLLISRDFRLFFLFLLLVLDLAILLKNSRLWFLFPIFPDVFLSLFRKPLFASFKLPDPIPYVSVMVSHSLSHYDDVRYCTIPQIALPTILLLSVWQILAVENSAHILMS